jgi:hypothetical protein
MRRLDEIFSISYGSQLDLNKCPLCAESDTTGYNFVNRSNKNCGVSARILEVDNKEPFEAGVITVAMGGSVLSSFVQQESFYTGQNVKVLKPRMPMPLIVKLYYCHCIESNKFRFSTFGREANYSFDSLMVPDIDELPDWLESYKIDYSLLDTAIDSKKILLNTENWKSFSLLIYFHMYAGQYYNKFEFSEGDISLVSSKDTNNGVMYMTDVSPRFEGNCLTIGKIGCVTYYQPKPFIASADVTVLKPKIPFNKYIGLFIGTIISNEKYRWTYGRQIRLGDCRELVIKLPADKNGEPDWQFMENYIKALPYSDKI